MSDSKEPKKMQDHQTRRRTLLAAIAGAGIPLSERVISGNWVSPVVDSVVLPAHANGSPGEPAGPVGRFGTALVGDNIDLSSFRNIAERSEQEILDLFIRTAEADTCLANSGCSGASASVEVVATINENPTTAGCIRARVTTTGVTCSASCLVFEFDATVNGSSVSVAQNCELKLTNMVLTEEGLKGDWNYSTDIDLNDSDTFTAEPNASGGCESMPLDSCPT